MMEFRTYDDKDDDGHYHGYQQDVYISEYVRRITHRGNWIHGNISGYTEWITAISDSGKIIFYIK